MQLFRDCTCKPTRTTGTALRVFVLKHFPREYSSDQRGEIVGILLPYLFPYVFVIVADFFEPNELLETSSGLCHSAIIPIGRYFVYPSIVHFPRICLWAVRILPLFNGPPILLLDQREGALCILSPYNFPASFRFSFKNLLPDRRTTEGILRVSPLCSCLATILSDRRVGLLYILPSRICFILFCYFISRTTKCVKSFTDSVITQLSRNYIVRSTSRAFN